MNCNPVKQGLVILVLAVDEVLEEVTVVIELQLGALQNVGNKGFMAKYEQSSVFFSPASSAGSMRMTPNLPRFFQS